MKQLITAVIFIVAVFSFSAPKTEERYFKKVKLDKSIRIINFSGISYLDTVVNVGVSSLGIKNVNIVLLPMRSEDYFNPYLLGYIEYFDGLYVIRLNSTLDKSEKILVISHEVCHLAQSYYGRLILKKDFIIFDGVYYSYYLNYRDRPWEIESFSKQSIIEANIIKQLTH